MSAGIEMFMMNTESLRSISPDHKLRLAAKRPTKTMPNIISICVTMCRKSIRFVLSCFYELGCKITRFILIVAVFQHLFKVLFRFICTDGCKIKTMYALMYRKWYQTHT